MDFIRPLPEKIPWTAMRDDEREQYFARVAAHQPLDRTAFREALAQRRSPAQQAERDSGNAARSEVAA